jgi:hypothetical protein
MGVTLWLPRHPLPGAAPSPEWRRQPLEAGLPSRLRPSAQSGVAARIETSHARAEVVGRPDTDPSHANPTPTDKVPLRQLLQGGASPTAPTSSDTASKPADLSPLNGSRGAAEEPPATAPVAASPAIPEAAPQFRLALISYSDCLVITELPTRQNLPWSEQHQRLLNAIVAAVGLGGGSQVVGGVREFIWPMDPQARFDQSAPIARQALQVELASVQQTSHRVLLLMGARSAEYVLPHEQTLALGQWGDCQGLPTLCCHGLNEVLRLPGLKAELWRQLQPLRRMPDAH